MRARCSFRETRRWIVVDGLEAGQGVGIARNPIDQALIFGAQLIDLGHLRPNDFILKQPDEIIVDPLAQA